MHDKAGASYHLSALISFLVFACAVCPFSLSVVLSLTLSVFVLFRFSEAQDMRQFASCLACG